MVKIWSIVFFVTVSLIARDFVFTQSVELKGELKQRVELTQKRLGHHPFDIELIVQDVARKKSLTRRFEEYEGDVSGRTLGAWSYISYLTGTKFFFRLSTKTKVTNLFYLVCASMGHESYGIAGS